jgi:hypothetical protein
MRMTLLTLAMTLRVAARERTEPLRRKPQHNERRGRNPGERACERSSPQRVVEKGPPKA